MTDPETLLTSHQLAERWKVGRNMVSVRLRRYNAQVVTVISQANRPTSAISESEALRVEAAVIQARIDAHAKSGESRRVENPVKQRPRVRLPKPSTPRKAVLAAVVMEPACKPAQTCATRVDAGKSRPKVKTGWHQQQKNVVPIRPQMPESPPLPPCEPTIAAIRRRYQISERVLRGWVKDGLLTFAAPDVVSPESMDRIARHYQPVRPTRWMERVMRECGNL